MRQTVVGVFDRYSAAQQAAQQLRDSGFGDSVYVTEQLDDTLDASSGSASTTGVRPADEGVFAHIRNFFSSIFGPDDDTEVGVYAEAVRRGGAVVKVEVDEPAEADAVRTALVHAGAVNLDEQVEGWRASGWRDDAAATTERAAVQPTSLRSTGEEDVVPVVQEDLQIGKRTVATGGVRVYARTVETPVSESVSLRSERAVVDRRPVDRPASQAEMDQLDETTIEVRETTERPVVVKEARVVEEVRVGKVVEERTEEIHDTVRNTEVSVESMPAERQGATGDLVDDDEFRSHFQSSYGSSGGRYEDYEPAYRYGSGLRSDARYTGRSWDEIEPDLRSDWERSHPGSAWERFKAAVRHGWDRMTS